MNPLADWANKNAPIEAITGANMKSKSSKKKSSKKSSKKKGGKKKMRM